MRPSSSNSSLVSRTIGCGAARRAARADVDVVAVKGDVELAELELDAGALLDQAAQPLGERHAARVDADERDRLEVVVALDDLVRDPGERSCDLFGVQEDPVRGGRGRVRHSTPFRPRWTGLKGDVPAQHTRTDRTARPHGLDSAIVDGRAPRALRQAGRRGRREHPARPAGDRDRGPDVGAARARDRRGVLQAQARCSSTRGTSTRT